MRVSSCLIAAAVSLLLLPKHAQAQRTAARQWSATTGAALPMKGGSVSAGFYLRPGLASATISALFPGDDTYRVCLSADWSQRLVSTRSRSLVLYGGAGAVAGYGTLKASSSEIPDEGSRSGSPEGLLLGLGSSLSCEAFILERTALVLSLSAEYIPAARQALLPFAGLGIRQCF